MILCVLLKVKHVDRAFLSQTMVLTRADESEDKEPKI